MPDKLPINLVAALLNVLVGKVSRQELKVAIGLKNAKHFRKAYVLTAIEAVCLEMTSPEQPQGRLQRFRLTAIGQHWLHVNSQRSTR